MDNSPFAGALRLPEPSRTSARSAHNTTPRVLVEAPSVRIEEEGIDRFKAIPRRTAFEEDSQARFKAVPRKEANNGYYDFRQEPSTLQT